MRLTIAIKSCIQHLQAGFHDEIRNTWGKDAKQLGIDVRFFSGDSYHKHAADEVFLDCPDDYNGLPKKTKAICEWAIGKLTDFLFLCDTDSYVKVRNIPSTGFQAYDYAGKIDRSFGETFPYHAISREGVLEAHGKCYPWASGGFGYFLSRKAFQIVSESQPMSWAEDLWVGNVLGPRYLTGEITMLNIPAGDVSKHFPSHEYKSGYDLSFNWMQQRHEECK